MDLMRISAVGQSGKTNSEQGDLTTVDAHGKRGVVAVIDRRPFSRHCIACLLSASMPEADTIHVASAAELVADYERQCEQIALVVLSIGSVAITESGHSDDISLLRARLAAVPLVILSDRETPSDVAEAFRHGAKAFIPTSLSPSIAIQALSIVQQGGTFVSGRVFQEMLEIKKPQPFDPEHSGDESGTEGFTQRQLEVLAHLRLGEPNKVIARALNMQESTVKVHVRRIMRKLHATNRTQAVIAATATVVDGSETITKADKQLTKRED